MGAYTDGNAMGAGTDTWLRDGGDIAEAFDKVADCASRTLRFATTGSRGASE